MDIETPENKPVTHLSFIVAEVSFSKALFSKDKNCITNI